MGGIDRRPVATHPAPVAAPRRRTGGGSGANALAAPPPPSPPLQGARRRPEEGSSIATPTGNQTKPLSSQSPVGRNAAGFRWSTASIPPQRGRPDSGRPNHFSGPEILFGHV